MTRKALVSILFSLLSIVSFAQDETYYFATKDGKDLYMDEYRPAKDKSTVNGKTKPTIIYVFGGGFVSGARNVKSQVSWFERLAEDGYRVFSIDYRLGLKGVSNSKGLLSFAKKTQKAVQMGVEDLFSATSYILDNAEMLGVDPKNIVVSGSSAGAIIALQAEWEISNSERSAAFLPSGFNYAGVISYSGAILSDKGTPKFKNAPCPTMLLHGTADKVVNYKQIKIFNWDFAGSSILAGKFSKNNYDYEILRFTDYGHEIAASMMYNYDELIKFIEEYVMGGKKGKTDRTISDATLDHWKMYQSKDDIYGGKKKKK